MKRLLAIVFTLALASGAATAEKGTGGGTGAEFLRLGMGARTAAMGDAGTAAPEGAASLHYNPAGLAWITRTEIDAMYQNYALDIDQGTFGWAKPWDDDAGWGLSVSYVDYGTNVRTTITNAGGAITGNTAGTFNGIDFSVGASYGQRYGQWAWGATLKGVHSDIDNVQASSLAGDFGLNWFSRSIPLSLGVVVKNFGTNYHFDRDNTELPVLVRGGAATHLWDGKVNLYADVEKMIHERAHFLGGGEYWIGDYLAFRAGYDGRIDIDDGFTGGIGARWDHLSVDYAFTPFGKIGDNHRIGIRYGFDTERRSEFMNTTDREMERRHETPPPTPPPPGSERRSHRTGWGGGSPSELIDW